VTLTLAEAKRIIDGAIGRALELHVEIAVTVCNGEGRFIALNRMDGAFELSGGDSIGKAIAAASTGRPSGEVEDFAASPRRTGTVLGEGWPVLNRRGGLPIIRDGSIEGACGVSGAKNDEADEDCARAGIALLGNAPGR
jgi:glc operon protein GlcG